MPKYQVFSSGGGTQSACITALIIQKVLPRPDFIVIADTGREMPTTWEYMDNVLQPALKKVGLSIIKVSAMEKSRQPDIYYHSKKTGEKGDLMIPFFSNKDNNPVKLPAFCSGYWKGNVVNEYLSKQGVKRQDYVKWIGFSLDETNRVLRMQKGEEYKDGLIRFPLVEQRLKRQDAIRLVEKMGWPTPPRSRCWMCPNQSDLQWQEVKTKHPDFFRKAIKMDELIRADGTNAFLHSTMQPLKSVDLSKEDDLFSDGSGCSSGDCFL